MEKNQLHMIRISCISTYLLKICTSIVYFCKVLTLRTYLEVFHYYGKKYIHMIRFALICTSVPKDCCMKMHAWNTLKNSRINWISCIIIIICTHKFYLCEVQTLSIYIETINYYGIRYIHMIRIPFICSFNTKNI